MLSGVGRTVQSAAERGVERLSTVDQKAQYWGAQYCVVGRQSLTDPGPASAIIRGAEERIETVEEDSVNSLCSDVNRRAVHERSDNLAILRQVDLSPYAFFRVAGHCYQEILRYLIPAGIGRGEAEIEGSGSRRNPFHDCRRHGVVVAGIAEVTEPGPTWNRNGGDFHILTAALNI